jgi:hypothetical protein
MEGHLMMSRKERKGLKIFWQSEASGAEPERDGGNPPFPSGETFDLVPLLSG